MQYDYKYKIHTNNASFTKSFSFLRGVVPKLVSLLAESAVPALITYRDIEILIEREEYFPL